MDGNARSQSARLFGVTIAATSPPRRRISLATKNTNGPVPETTVLLPGVSRSRFINAVAPANPITPGKVHPGIGWTYSRAPVAKMSTLALIFSERPFIMK